MLDAHDLDDRSTMLSNDGEPVNTDLLSTLADRSQSEEPEAPTVRDKLPAGLKPGFAARSTPSPARTVGSGPLRRKTAKIESPSLWPIPDLPDEHIGRVIGSLRLVRKLAEGGMGSVYLAKEQISGRTAAVKILLPSFARNRNVVQRFFNEAKAAQAIEHPGVVKIFGADYDDRGNAYIVMEYLEGESLADRLARDGRMAIGDSLEIARQVFSALAATHARGIVHRDLKPGNIFLIPDPSAPGGQRVKLLDFGVAKLLSQGTPLTSIGDLIGTPLYMAPEQCRASGQIDHRADLYAMGCLLYAMICGRPPFAGNYPGDVICAHLQAPVPPVRMFASDVSEEVEALIMALLHKAPAKRPQSTDEVVQRVAEILDGPPADDDEDSGASENRRPVLWRRLAVIGSAGLLAMAGGVLALLAI